MKRFFSVAALIALGVSLVFAGGGQSAGGSTVSGGIPGDGQPFGKYNPPITVNSSKKVSETNFETGDTIDKNPWITKNLNDLGINISCYARIQKSPF